MRSCLLRRRLQGRDPRLRRLRCESAAMSRCCSVRDYPRPEGRGASTCHHTPPARPGPIVRPPAPRLPPARPQKGPVPMPSASPRPCPVGRGAGVPPASAPAARHGRKRQRPSAPAVGARHAAPAARQETRRGNAPRKQLEMTPIEKAEGNGNNSPAPPPPPRPDLAARNALHMRPRPPTPRPRTSQPPRIAAPPVLLHNGGVEPARYER
jgi:hypothetical protein